MRKLTLGKIVKNGVTYSGSSDNADNVKYNNNASNLDATNVQEAIDKLDESVDTLNSNLEWKNIKNINRYPTALNSAIKYQNDLLKGACELDIYIGALGHLYIACNRNSSSNIIIKPSYYISQNWNACATVSFNSATGTIELIMFSKGSSDSFTDFTIQYVNYR